MAGVSSSWLGLLWRKGGGVELHDDTKNGCVADYVSIHDIPFYRWQLIGNRVGFSSEESDLRNWRINIIFNNL